MISGDILALGKFRILTLSACNSLKNRTNLTAVTLCIVLA